MFENKVLRRIIVYRKEEVAVGRRILRADDVQNFCTSLDIIRVIKLRWISLAKHVVRVG
jgi:hypothetical protein